MSANNLPSSSGIQQIISLYCLLFLLEHSKTFLPVIASSSKVNFLINLLIACCLLEA